MNVHRDADASMKLIADLIERIEHSASSSASSSSLTITITIHEDSTQLFLAVDEFHREGLARLGCVQEYDVVGSPSLLSSTTREDVRAKLRDVLEMQRVVVERAVRECSSVDSLVVSDPMVASLLELHDLLPAASSAGHRDPGLVAAENLVRKKSAPASQSASSSSSSSSSSLSEACELCGVAVGVEHPHLVALATGKVACSCRACALLFEGDGGVGARSRYRRIPDGVQKAEASLAKDDAWWREIGLPIGLAFFTRRDDGATIARYPGPFGTTESLISAERWSAIASMHPSLSSLTPEVQTLLVDRSDGAREHWIVGIDRAYELVSRIRERWQGLMGGEEVKKELHRFFASFESRARPS